LELIHLAQDRGQKRFLTQAVTNRHVPVPLPAPQEIVTQRVDLHVCAFSSKRERVFVMGGITC
jgi:hypothetical protein